MGTISRHSTQVIAKNSTKIKSLCLGMAMAAVAGAGEEVAEGTILNPVGLAVAIASADGVHPVDHINVIKTQINIF